MRSIRLVFLALPFLQTIGCSQERFPQLVVRPLSLQGEWESAPIVVVGDVRNILPAGTQNIRTLPPPASPTVKKIYWCIGDFEGDSAIKGRAPTSGKKFLWGTARPGCELYGPEQTQGEQHITRV